MSELDQNIDSVTPEQASAAEAYGQLNGLITPYIEAYTNEGLPLGLLQGADLEFTELITNDDVTPRTVNVRIGANMLTPVDDSTAYYLYDRGSMMSYDVQPTQVTPPLQLDSLGQVAGREYVDKRFAEIKDMIDFIGAQGTQFKGITLAPRLKVVK